MKLFVLFVVTLVFTFSCSNPGTKLREKNCVVRLDSLIRSIDTSLVESVKFSLVDSVEVRDKSVHDGEGSVFHFDRSGRLGVYAFMVYWPTTNFMIVYDSTGKKQRLQENEVVQW